MRNELTNLQSSVGVEVQCQLADTSQSMLLEMAALRARLAEMQEETQKQEQSLRQTIHAEHHNLVQALVRSIMNLKRKFEEFQQELYDDVLQRINETRAEANEAIAQLVIKTGTTVG